VAIDFPTSPTAGQQYAFNGVTYVFTSQGVWATAGASAITVINGSPQGRLTLQTLTPVMTTTLPHGKSLKPVEEFWRVGSVICATENSSGAIGFRREP